MVDFRKSGVSSGGLGIYSATKTLTSPASSSLDKPAGTLSSKTSADIAQTGQIAQRLLQNVPRELNKEYTSSMRSYAYTQALFNTDYLLNAEAQLTEKFIEQANPEQKQSLFVQAASLGEGYQRTVAEMIKQDDTNKPVSFNKYLLIGGLIAAGVLLK